MAAPLALLAGLLGGGALGAGLLGGRRQAGPAGATNGGLGGPNDHSTRDDILAFLLGGPDALMQQKTVRRVMQQKQMTTERERAQLQGEADALGLQGRERAVFLRNPDEWSKQNATRYAAHNVGQNARMMVPGDDPSKGQASSAWTGDMFAREGPDGQAQYSSVRPQNPDEVIKQFIAETQRNEPKVVGAGATLTAPDGRPLYRAPDIKSIDPEHSVFEDPGIGGAGGTPSAGGLIPPVDGRISSDFGNRTNPNGGGNQFHNGVDYAVPEGTPVRAAGDGEVVQVGSDGRSGNFVIIRHPNGQETSYSHLSEMGVRRGDAVRQGQVFAKSGRSGNATGPNLHFVVRDGDKPVNPTQATGYRMTQRGRPKVQERWEQINPQQQRNTATGEIKGIPGAPPDRTRQMEAQAAKAESIIATVDQALKSVSGATAGFWGGQTRRIAGTPAYDLASQVETIKANLGFQELQAMREASPTGGALGQVAVQELQALQATVANLDTAQSPAQLQSNLNKIKQHYQRWLDATQGRGGGGSSPPPKTFDTPHGKVTVRAK
jgi:murein DD-endopeptidase MepM/ murein hydrolase activator NlpD